MKHILPAAISVLMALSLACAPMPPGHGNKESDLAEAEREFDPLAQDADRPIVIGSKDKGTPGEESAAQDRESSAQEQSSSLRPGLAQGYRVQIFLTDDLRETSRIMAEAKERFEEEVYLEYDAPYYKVRVGDCLTEREGEALQEIARRLGYPEAWLVRTLVNLGDEAGPR